MRFTYLNLAFILLILLMGCSGLESPVNPARTDNPAAGDTRLATGQASSEFEANPSQGRVLPDSSSMFEPAGHALWGIWRIRLYDDGSFEITPQRTEQAHFNVTAIVKQCADCLQIAVGPPPGANQFEFNVTLKNPTNLTAYDVTGIVRFSGDIKFLNPDSYSFLFSFPGDTKPNPYAMWASAASQHVFGAHESLTETLQFEKGGLSKFADMDYVIQASYPGNQEEPWAIHEMSASAALKSDMSNQVDLQCRVGDWQGNIDSVKIDLTAIGGASNAQMNLVQDDLYKLTGISYNSIGQGAGDHLLKITATSNGVSTYNYLPVTVELVQPIIQGSFEVVAQNLPLVAPDGPTDGKDIAVMGATDGTAVTMVFGDDDTYHFWTGGYKEGAFGLYNGDTGDPIVPFDMPNSKFDFADVVIPDTSIDTIFGLSWGETNTSSAVLDATTTPPVLSNERIALWYLNAGNLRLTANVLVQGYKPGPPKTYDLIVRPIEVASGFRGDGLLYVAMAYAAGDQALFPIIDVIGFHPPLDFANNPTMITDGYEVALEEGSGPGTVNRDALVGLDIDDSNIMEISGGYGGHAWIAAVEAGAEKALEIVDADIDAPSNTWVTINLPAMPKDVAILPLKEAGEPGNWIAVLFGDNMIRLYDYTGALKETIGGSPYMVGSALRLDIDDENLAIHVLHQGTTSPLVTVYKWVG